MRFLVLFLIRCFFRVFYRIKVRGLENIPLSGSLIVAANHNSNADPPALMSFLALKRSANILAKKELFSPSILGKAFSYFGAIPIDRQAVGGDISAMKKSLKVLKSGGCLVIFPQGTRSVGKNVDPKQGAVFLAAKTGAAILPVKIFNTENFSKLGKIIVMFGKPIVYDFSVEEKDYGALSRNLMKEIFDLDPKK